MQNTVIFKTTTRNNEGFAEALGSINGDKGKGKSPKDIATLIAINIQSLLSPHSLLNCFFKTKKGEDEVFVWHSYGRFLSIINAVAIAIIMATVEMAKYISVGGRTVTGYGDGVDAASSTPT